MADWAWHTFDLATGLATGKVSMAAWSHEDRLNDAGSWSATMAPRSTTDLTRAALAATTAGKAVVVAVRVDDRGATRAEFAGWLPPGGNRRPELAGGGLLSYFDSRVLTELYPAAAVDQFTIVTDLIGLAHAGLVDTSQVGASGVLRDQTWQPWEFKNIGEAIRQIAGRINGFDFDIRVELDAGSPVRRLRCWYPRRGTTSGPTFEYGRNMLSEPEIEGNPDFATRVLALGEETDPDTHQRITSIRTADSLLAFGYPLIDRREDRDDIKVQQSLDDHAAGVLDTASNDQDDEISFRVDPNDPTWMWGTWDLGDDCRMIVPAELLPWWPDGRNERRRIVAHRWTVDEDDDNGTEDLTVVTGRSVS